MPAATSETPLWKPSRQKCSSFQRQGQLEAALLVHACSPKHSHPNPPLWRIASEYALDEIGRYKCGDRQADIQETVQIVDECASFTQHDNQNPSLRGASSAPLSLRASSHAAWQFRLSCAAAISSFPLRLKILFHHHPDKHRIRRRIAFPHPPGFLQQTVKPFHSSFPRRKI